jgi:hypothetical protein
MVQRLHQLDLVLEGLLRVRILLELLEGELVARLVHNQLDLGLVTISQSLNDRIPSDAGHCVNPIINGRV